MNNEDLKNYFLNQAKRISKEASATARFRANAYRRAAGIVEANTKPKSKVTAASLSKLELTEYMKNKALSVFKTKETPIENTLINQLTSLKGIGAEKAKALMEAGVTTMSQLKLKKYRDLLPDETKTFMSLKPLQRIPHEHIKILEPYLLKAATKDIALILTGSYRRKKPFSSDIDIMVISDNPNAISILLKRLEKILKGNVYPYSQGTDKMSLVVDMSDILDSPKKIYKIDAFRTLTENKIPMLLYSTGSKEFNITMRSRAKKLGYLLNQKGLFKNGDKVPDLNSEADYFKVLKMEYKTPEMRI